MSATVYWTLIDSFQAPLEDPTAFLTSLELEKLATFRFSKRRDEWLLGRWAAKSLLRNVPAYQHHCSRELEIRNEPAGAPYLCLADGTVLPGCLSISHRDGLALCALAPSPDLRVGIDLEKIESRTETFILDYFTEAEQAFVERCTAEARALAVTLVWSVKESMLKALRVGLHRDTRRVELHQLEDLLPVNGRGAEWQKIKVADLAQGSQPWAAWWRQWDKFVITLAAFSVESAEIHPILLEQGLQPGTG